MKLSVSILKADRVHLCHLQLCFSVDRIRSIYGSVDLWTQTNIDEILCHGDRINNKMVPDANSLSVKELLKVATSQNNGINFTMGSVDRHIDRYVDRHVGRWSVDMSVDSPPLVDRQSVDSRPIWRSIAGR